MGEAIVTRDSTNSPNLTVHDVMAYVGVGAESAVYRLIRDHGLPFRRLGRRYRFKQIEIDAWLKPNGATLDIERSRSARKGLR